MSIWLRLAPALHSPSPFSTATSLRFSEAESPTRCCRIPRATLPACARICLRKHIARTHRLTVRLPQRATRFQCGQRQASERRLANPQAIDPGFRRSGFLDREQGFSGLTRFGQLGERRLNCRSRLWVHDALSCKLLSSEFGEILEVPDETSAPIACVREQHSPRLDTKGSLIDANRSACADA
jgi:hypothetical protein